jgi:hypothetical protein
MGRERAQQMLEADLEALRGLTARGLPAWEATASAGPPASRARRRPALARVAAGAAAAGGLATLLAFVPFTYPTVAGQEITLSLAGRVDDTARREIARGFRAGVGGASLEVSADPETVTMRAFVAGVPRARADEDAVAFANLVRARGLGAEVFVSPRQGSARGSLYAFAGDRLRRLMVDVRHRAEADIEADLRRRLEEIGFRDSAITVQRDARGVTVSFSARDPEGRSVENEYRRELTGPAAANEPPVEIVMPDLSDLDALPIEERRAAIERRFRERGIEARVTIEDGELRVETDQRIRRRK